MKIDLHRIMRLAAGAGDFRAKARGVSNHVFKLSRRDPLLNLTVAGDVLSIFAGDGALPAPSFDLEKFGEQCRKLANLSIAPKTMKYLKDEVGVSDHFLHLVYKIYYYLGNFLSIDKYSDREWVEDYKQLRNDESVSWSPKWYQSKEDELVAMIREHGLKQIPNYILELLEDSIGYFADAAGPPEKLVEYLGRAHESVYEILGEFDREKVDYAFQLMNDVVEHFHLQKIK